MATDRENKNTDSFFGSAQLVSLSSSINTPDPLVRPFRSKIFARNIPRLDIKADSRSGLDYLIVF